MQHEIKISPSDYKRISSGAKGFLVLDNENFQAGDKIKLNEWDGKTINPITKSAKGYTGSSPLEFNITYVEVLDRSSVVINLQSLKKQSKASK